MEFRSRKRIKQASHKQDCERFEECSFITKFEKSEECSIKDYQHLFCSGHLMEECERLRFFRENQVEAPEDMAPTGIYLNRASNFTRNPKHKPEIRVFLFSETRKSRQFIQHLPPLQRLRGIPLSGSGHLCPCCPANMHMPP